MLRQHILMYVVAVPTAADPLQVVWFGLPRLIQAGTAPTYTSSTTLISLCGPYIYMLCCTHRVQKLQPERVQQANLQLEKPLWLRTLLESSRRVKTALSWDL